MQPTGPVNIHERVRRAMAVPSLNHRDPWFKDFYIKILEDVKVIFNTSDVAPSSSIASIIYPGTGTGGWESALQNTLSPGDKIVTFRYGMFSKLWVRPVVSSANSAAGSSCHSEVDWYIEPMPAVAHPIWLHRRWT